MYGTYPALAMPVQVGIGARATFAVHSTCPHAKRRIDRPPETRSLDHGCEYLVRSWWLSMLRMDCWTISFHWGFGSLVGRAGCVVRSLRWSPSRLGPGDRHETAFGGPISGWCGRCPSRSRSSRRTLWCYSWLVVLPYPWSRWVEWLFQRGARRSVRQFPAWVVLVRVAGDAIVLTAWRAISPREVIPPDWLGATRGGWERVAFGAIVPMRRTIKT